MMIINYSLTGFGKYINGVCGKEEYCAVILVCTGISVSYKVNSVVYNERHYLIYLEVNTV